MLWTVDVESADEAVDTAAPPPQPAAINATAAIAANRAKYNRLFLLRMAELDRRSAAWAICR